MYRLASKLGQSPNGGVVYGVEVKILNLNHQGSVPWVKNFILHIANFAKKLPIICIYKYVLTLEVKVSKKICNIETRLTGHDLRGSQIYIF